jgi:hypothetical protein
VDDAPVVLDAYYHHEVIMILIGLPLCVILLVGSLIVIACCSGGADREMSWPRTLPVIVALLVICFVLVQLFLYMVGFATFGNGRKGP